MFDKIKENREIEERATKSRLLLLSESCSEWLDNSSAAVHNKDKYGRHAVFYYEKKN